MSDSAVFLGYVVTLLTANSLMDDMQMFNEQLKQKMSQANRMQGSYSGAQIYSVFPTEAVSVLLTRTG